MNFFKRATTSIIRRPGKTIILLLLVFILGSVIAGAISVEGAISNTDANLRRNMQPIVSIGFDDMAFHESVDWDAVDWDAGEDPWMNRPILTPSDVRAIANLPYVESFNYMIQGGLQSFDLEQYRGDGDFFSGMEGEPNWFSLLGTATEELIHIEQGVIDLVQGNQFSSSDLNPGGERSVAIVSEAFANQNGLSLGSILTLYNVITYPNEDGEIWWGWGADFFSEENIHELVTTQFEIVGLYDIPLDPDAAPHSQEWWDRMDSLNRIYVPNWALEDNMRRTSLARQESFVARDLEVPQHWVANTGDEDEESGVVSLFVLENPAYIDDFRAAAEPLLPEYHRIEDLSSTFDDIASSMETMQNIANWILYVSIGATLLILSLLITLFLRDRRYEMGVYLALGEKKGRIISQILLEVLVTSFVAITLSVFVGNLISSAVSHNMLMNELQAESNDDPWGHREWGVFEQIGIPRTSMSVDEMMDQFDVSLTMGTIGLFYVVGLGAVVVSSLFPVIYVVTLNPKKVLM